MHIERARRPGVRSAAGAALTVAVALCLGGCSPRLDWREVRPEGDNAAMLFPCRPQLQERKASLGGEQVPMRLHSCSAGGASFSLLALDLADPARVTTELAALRAAAIANLAGSATEARPLAPVGATPNPESARLHIVGRRPDGSRVVADAAFFVKGLTLYQATVLGSEDARGHEAVDAFFAAIRLP
ncbi:MAG: hypothetical protein ACXWUL_10505 [Caldimonas sp.]